MAKAAKPKGGAPSWMVTFADMMALLLCLFVLLLSFSEMDKAKFKQVAGQLEQAFGVALKSKLLGMIEIGGSPHKKTYRDVEQGPVASITLPGPPDPTTMEVKEELRLDLPAQASPSETLHNLLAILSAEIADELLGVSEKEGTVIIRFPDKAAFSSGMAQLTPDFLPTLDKVATVLARTDGEIIISGHTDDVPIRTARFRSNWDLSSSRAASVVLYLMENTDIDSARVTAAGYADSRPLDSNATEQGRATNRRVEISILKNEPGAAEDNGGGGAEP